MSLALLRLANETAFGSVREKFAEVRREQIGPSFVGEFQTALSVRMRPDGKNRAFRVSKDFFGDRAQYQLFEAAAAVCPDHDQIDLFLEDYCFQFLPDAPLRTMNS
jgi:hypothetical protein